MPAKKIEPVLLFSIVRYSFSDFVYGMAFVTLSIAIPLAKRPSPSKH